MDRTAIAYLNYLRHQVYINYTDESDKLDYVNKVYDITTDIESIKNYLGIDCDLQRSALSIDTSDYQLVIDDSQFVRDHTTIEVTDIYFSDISNTIRYDNSILLFTRDELISDYTKTLSSTILHFEFTIKKYPDITDFQVYSFPIFILPNISSIANDLIIQYDINFVHITLFNEHGLLITLKEYIESNYVARLDSRFNLAFLGQNHVSFIDYKYIAQTMIVNQLQNALSNEQRTIRDDAQKFYIHDSTTMFKLTDNNDTTKIVDFFSSTILDFYNNHVDQTIDPFAGMSTDRDLYDVVQNKTGTIQSDMLNINFLRFVLIRKNIYNQKFSLLHDGTEFQTEYIKFRVMNVIPNQTYDFTLVANEFDLDITSDHTTDLPLKIDVCEYSNNLVQTGSPAYSRFIGEYYFDGFNLKFKINKKVVNYGYNSLRIFVSDTLSETYKDIIKPFIYAPQSVISDKIAKITFTPVYSSVRNTFSVEKLLPLSEDYTSYSDLSARFTGDSSKDWMYVEIPIRYELIYSKNISATIRLETLDSTGELLSQFEYLVQDVTEKPVTLVPTLDIESDGGAGKTIMVMFRYKFDNARIYTDEIIQKLSGIVHGSIISDDTVDETDVNYFKEYIDINFNTTRFKMKFIPKSTYVNTPSGVTNQSIQATSYAEKDIIEFKPPYSTVETFTLRTSHSAGQVGSACNFMVGFDNYTTLMQNKLINRSNTVKLIPISIDLPANQIYTVNDYEFASRSADGTTPVEWTSPQIGYIKQMDNFSNDMIQLFVLDKFGQQIVDLFNWYMSHVNNDIQMTYRTLQDMCNISVGQRSEFIPSVLSSDSSYNSQPLIQYIFDYYNLDYTSSHPYKKSDILSIRDKFVQDTYMGLTTYTSYQKVQRYESQIDIKFATSEVYRTSNFNYILREAFVAKFFNEKMPNSQKYTRYGDIGVLGSSGKYTYGDNFRLGYFGNDYKLIDTSSDLWQFVYDTGLNKGSGSIYEYFCDNVKIDFTTADHVELSLTTYEVIELYFSDTYDASYVMKNIRDTIFNSLGVMLNDKILVKQVYTADLSCSIDTISDDVLSIYLAPTTLSPLFSRFRIKDIKFITDSNVVTITKLFNDQQFTSKTYYINEILGTGIKFTFKYLNRSIEDVPCSVMIYYIDELGYEKTTSVTGILKSKLQTFINSEAAYLLKQGMNILKGLQLLQVFDGQADVIQNTEEALRIGVDSVMANAEFSAITNANQYWGGLFEAKKRYNKIFKQYLSSETLDAFYYNYLEHRLYGRPVFSQNCNVSMFIAPENVELLDVVGVNNKIAEDAVAFLLDSSYHANTPWNRGQGGSLNPYLDYSMVINDYYDRYLDRMGYDINLVLLPDTTYNISLKSYLVFTQNLQAGEKAMGTLSGFLSDIGGGDEHQCMVNLREFLTLGRIFPNYEDLIRGVLRDLFIPLNFERYGRVPSAMSPITVREYYPNQYEADYNTFVKSAVGYYVEFEKSNKAHFGLVIPFEKTILQVDTTSTGLFDMNFTHYSRSLFNTGFKYSDEMLGSNIHVGNQKEKITVSVRVPSLIPDKFIDVIVRSLF